MRVDQAALGKAGCAGDPSVQQLCRANLDRFRAALALGQPMTVGCTQEAPPISAPYRATASSALRGACLCAPPARSCRTATAW